MRSKLAITSLGLLLSCHAPIDQASSGQISLADAAQALHWPDPTDGDDPIPALVLRDPPANDDPTVIVVDTQPKQRRASTPDQSRPEQPKSIDLCCDEPSGLCYRGAPNECTSQTSIRVVCPPALVRVVCERDGIVICAR